jgi:hypothetical protein
VANSPSSADRPNCLRAVTAAAGAQVKSVVCRHILLDSNLVLSFEIRLFIRAGTRNGNMQVQITIEIIKTQTRTLSHLRGRRDRGAVRPIETAKDNMRKIARPFVIQEKGQTKYSKLLYLARISKIIAMQGRK